MSRDLFDDFVAPEVPSLPVEARRFCADFCLNGFEFANKKPSRFGKYVAKEHEIQRQMRMRSFDIDKVMRGFPGYQQ